MKQPKRKNKLIILAIKIITDEAWKQKIFNWLQPKSNIWRKLEDNDRLVGFVEGSKIIGALMFSDYDGNNIFVHLSIDDPRACQRRYIKFMFNYCFITAKCNRMTALCENNYERNEKLLQGVGFTKEGIIRQGYCKNGKFVDGAVYGMLKQECKWIKGN